MRLKKEVKKPLFFLAAFLAELFPFLVRAALVPGGKQPLGWCEFFQMIQNIINFLLFELSIPLATLGFIWAGFLYLFSGGSEDRVGTAKRVFTQIVIGLFVAFSSWLIINFVLNMLGGQSFSNVIGHPWNKLQCH